MEHIAAERRALPPEEFARERLGWWEEPIGNVSGLPLNLWDASTLGCEPGDLLALAVDATPDLAYASIARATAVPTGILLDVAEHRQGTAWVAAEIARIRGASSAPVALDLGGPASVVNADLTHLDPPIETVNPDGRDVAQACSNLLDGLIRRSVWHAATPELDAAVRGASRRPLGDAWAWSRKNSLVDISPLVAATLALWGVSMRDEDVTPLVAWT